MEDCSDLQKTSSNAIKRILELKCNTVEPYNGKWEESIKSLKNQHLLILLLFFIVLIYWCNKFMF